MSNLTQDWLEDQTSIRCLLVEITALNVITGFEVTFYLSNAGYTTTTADVSYLPYLTRALQTTESLSIDGLLTMSSGNIEVANFNGELDSWLDSTQYIWANRPVSVYLGDPRWTASNLAAVRTTFEKVFDGVIADVDSSSREYLNVKVRDKLEKLNYPITDNVIGVYGTWSGGQSNQDAIRPLILGEVNNITPVLVDPSKLEYMFSDTSVVTNVTATNSATNELTCTSTLGMDVNKPISFSVVPLGSGFTEMLGDLSPEINKYYVRSITSPTTFTLQLGNGSRTIGSSDVENIGADCIYVGASQYIYLGSNVSGFTVNQPVIFLGAGVPAPLVAGTVYYVATVSTVTSSAIRVSTTVGGSVLSIPNNVAAYTNNPTSPTWWVVQNIGDVLPLSNTTGNILAETRATTFTTICTSCTATTFTCTSTRGFNANKPIIFNNPVFGGIIAGVTYYIKLIGSTTTFTISTTLVNNIAGPTLTLVAGSGNMFAEVVTSGNESVIEIRDNGVPIYINPIAYTGSSTRPDGALVNNATGKFTLTSPASGTITASVQGVRQSVNLLSSTLLQVFEGNYINNANNLIALIALKYGQANNRLTSPELDLVNLSSYSTSDAYIFTAVSGVTHSYIPGTTESTLLLTGTNMDTYSSYIAPGDWMAVSGLAHTTLSNILNNAVQILTISSTRITLRLPNAIAQITGITIAVGTPVTLTKIDWASVGIAILNRTNVLNVLNSIAASVGGQVFFNRLGKLQLLKLGTRTIDEIINITDNDIMHHSLYISRKTEVIAATKIGYCLNYTPQTSLAASLPSTANTMFTEPWYSTTVLDTAVQSKYKLDSIAVQKDTNLLSSRDAAALALKLNNYFKVPRTVYAFTGTAKLLGLKLGQGITLTHNRFGLNSGKAGQVITLAPDWASGTVNIEVII